MKKRYVLPLIIAEAFFSASKVHSENYFSLASTSQSNKIDLYLEKIGKYLIGFKRLKDAAEKVTKPFDEVAKQATKILEGDPLYLSQESLDAIKEDRENLENFRSQLKAPELALKDKIKELEPLLTSDKVANRAKAYNELSDYFSAYERSIDEMKDNREKAVKNAQDALSDFDRIHDFSEVLDEINNSESGTALNVLTKNAFSWSALDVKVHFLQEFSLRASEAEGLVKDYDHNIRLMERGIRDNATTREWVRWFKFVEGSDLNQEMATNSAVVNAERLRNLGKGFNAKSPENANIENLLNEAGVKNLVVRTEAARLFKEASDDAKHQAAIAQFQAILSLAQTGLSFSRGFGENDPPPSVKSYERHVKSWPNGNYSIDEKIILPASPAPQQ